MIISGSWEAHKHAANRIQIREGGELRKDLHIYKMGCSRQQNELQPHRTAQTAQKGSKCDD